MERCWHDVKRAARGRVGQKLGGGKYRLEALLGLGGAAAVYAASHRNGRRVAVKVLHGRVEAGGATGVRFTRESYLSNLLEHEGVVRVFDDDVTEDGAAYLVMELLEGASLRAIASELPLDMAYVMALGDALLSVLEAAHGVGVVHRDVKPENIFLTEEGVLKLLDFGLARQFDDFEPGVTASGVILGTPAFMAPEQARRQGRLVGPSADLWSVGATLFTLVTGRHVHEGETAIDVLAATVTRPAEPLSGVSPSCPAALCEVVDKALRREIAERWPDAGAMRLALREAFSQTFGKPVDTKALLRRMAVEVLPIVASGGRRKASGGGEVSSRGPTWSPSAPPSGPLAGGEGRYLEPPPTLRSEGDALPRRACDSAPLLATGAAESGTVTKPDAFSAPWSGDGTQVSLFQVETAVSQSDTLGPQGRRKVVTFVRALVAALAAAMVAIGLWGKFGAEAKLCPDLPATHASGRGDAEVAYCQAFQLWQDGALSKAQARFEEAARLGPAFAEAHLYAVAVAREIDAGAREHFNKARDSRQMLAPDEAALFEALEPSLRDASRSAETERALEALAAPPSAPLAFKLAFAQHLLRNYRLDRAIEVADGIRGPAGDWLGAAARLNAGDVEGGTALLRRCAEGPRASVDCLTALAEIDAHEGRCGAVEESARKLVVADQGSPLGYRHLARAVMGQRHSTAEAREALKERWAAEQPAARDEIRAADEFYLYVYDGEFDLADESLRRWQQAASSSANGFRRLIPLLYRLDFELELDRKGGAEEAARSIDAAWRVWLPDDSFDYGLEGVRALYLTGQIGRDEMRRRREAAPAPPAQGGHLDKPDNRWFETYMSFVRDEVDAREAMSKEPPDRPLVDAFGLGDHPRRNTILGRAYALGGRPDKAERPLRRAVGACWFGESLHVVQAHLWLGDVLASREDRNGACEAYGKVVERWGRDGRSVSARAARAKQGALGCAR